MATVSRIKKAVFYHIPKCAGLYIDSILSEEEDFITYNFTSESKIKFYWSPEIGIREEFHQKCEKFLIDPESLKTYFEFTFVRNPYTRFVSAFFYCKGCNFEEKSKMKNLKTIINNRNSVSDETFFHLFKTQWKNIEYSKPIDYIGRFENLDSDLERIFQILGLPLDYSREIVNENPVRYGDYRRYITQEVLEFINFYFDIDFKMFNYPKVERIEDLT